MEVKLSFIIVNHEWLTMVIMVVLPGGTMIEFTNTRMESGL